MRLRFVVATCVVAALAAQASAADAVVTNGADDIVNPPAGSLRAAVNQAVAGNTITFDAAVKNVALVGAIDVDATQSRLTFRGPCQITPKSAKLNTPFVIRANDVAFDGLTFFNCDVHADDDTKGLRVTNCLFSGKRSGITLTKNAGVVIGTPAAKNTFHGIPRAIVAFQTSGSTIENNDFDKCAFVLDDASSSSLTVRGNRVTGGTISGSPVSGTITGNVIAVARFAAIYIEPIPSPGPLTISDNVITLSGHADGIEAFGRGSLSVLANTIGGRTTRTAITIYRGATENDFDGTVVVAGNVVLGSAFGISVDAGRPPGPAITIASNTVGPVSATGIFVRAFAPGTVQVSSNILNTIGRSKKGTGIAIQNLGSTATVGGNTLTGTLGTGIVVLQDSTLVTVAGNIVDRCTLHGIGVQTNATAAIADCVVTDADGSGVFANGGSHVAIDGTSFGTTRGPEIDLAPLKATPNATTKTANDDLDYPQAAITVSGDVEGTTVANGRVTLFAPGTNGLVAPLTDVTADGAGRFTIAKATLPAGDFRLLVHAPDDADVSELSPPVKPAPPDDGGGVTTEPGTNGTVAEVSFPRGSPVAGTPFTIILVTQNPGSRLPGPETTGKLVITGIPKTPYEFILVFIAANDPEHPEYADGTTVMPLTLKAGRYTLTAKLDGVLLWRVSFTVAAAKR